jgi:membrane protease YdiL (CAAX protease family)
MLEPEILSGPESTVESANTLKGRVWGFWPTVGFGCVIGVAYVLTAVLITVVIVIALFIGKPLPTDPEQYLDLLTGTLGLTLSLTALATAIVGVCLILLFIKLKGNITIVEYLGFHPIRIKAVLAVIAVVIGFLLVSGALSSFMDRPVPELMVDAYKTSVWPVLFWIAVIVCAPVFEEVFFRGFLFEGFRYSRIGIIGAIVLTSLIWASLHVQYDAFEMLLVFVMGLLLGVVRYKTGSLWGPLLMHGLNNLAATVELALYINGVIT